ncbi:MAG: hypothetical protein ACD_46C00535G0005 [uncultured bacterium]|nr:MAG: hypothetical protein ACD_46C00535G0005 [uncultured bacterium]
MNIILLLGSLIGLSSVMMAAFVDHSLALQLDAKALSAVLTAVRYHQLYAILISVIGLLISLQLNHKMKWWLNLTGFIFIIGIFIFSCSIYLRYIFQMTGIIYFTPSGGLLLMLGWVCLMRTACLMKQ